MPYANTAAVLRPDVNTKVEEANLSDELFIGSKILPVFSSDSKTGQYPVFKKGISELMKNDATTRARGGSYGRVIRAYDTDTYACEDRGLEEAVDDTDQKDLSRFFNLEADTARRVKKQVMIGHEIRAAALVFDNSVFTSTNSATAYTEANIASMSIVADMLDIIDRLTGQGRNPNAVAMSTQVWNRIRRATLLQNFLRGHGASSDTVLNLGPQQFANAFGLSKCLIGRAAYDTAAKGKGFSSSFIWNNTYIWVGEILEGEFENGGAGRTIVWNKEGGLWVTETYRSEIVRSDIVRVRQNTDEKIIDASAAQLIATQYS